jgi:hypothetical protein
MDTGLGIMLRDSSHTKIFSGYTCNCYYTSYPNRLRLQLSDLETECLHHARRQLTVAPIFGDLGLLVTD